MQEYTLNAEITHGIDGSRPHNPRVFICLIVPQTPLLLQTHFPLILEGDTLVYSFLLS